VDSLDSRSRVPHQTRALVRYKGTVLYGEPLHCHSCGSQDGWVTRDLPPGVIYLCDECEHRYGVPPELREVH